MQAPIPVEIDLYRVLGVPDGADAAAIKRAWRQLAAKYHPDALCTKRHAAPDSAAPPSAEDRFLGIREAYAILGDAERRKEYDLARREWLSRERSGGGLCLRAGLPCGMGIPCRGAPGPLLRNAWTRVSAIPPLIWVPWPLLVRVRFLLAAVLLMLGMLSLHFGGLRGRTAPVLPAPVPAPPEAVFPEDAGKGADPRLLGATVAPGPKLAARSPAPPRSRRRRSSRKGPTPAAASDTAPSTPVTGTVPVRLPVQDAPSILLASPHSGSPEIPFLEQAEQPPWEDRWLAGCLSGESVYLGSLDIASRVSRFEWRSWDSTEPAGVLETMAEPHPAQRPAQILLKPAALPTSPESILTRSSQNSAKLRFQSPSLAGIPCREWYLIPLAANLAITGRWLLPDTARRSGEEAFPLEYLELRIENGPNGPAGRMASQYYVGSSGARPTVDLSFQAGLRDFRGVFQWESVFHGRGSLTVVPLSPSRLAIRWQVNDLIPGKLQLTGGAALLRRR